MRKKYLEKRARVNEDQSQDILERPGFKEAAAALGKKWLSDRQPIVTMEDSNAWNEWHRNNDSDYMRQWPEVRVKILEARNAGNFQEEQRLTEEFNAKRPINALQLDIEKLIQEFNIQPKWFNGI